MARREYRVLPTVKRCRQFNAVIQTASFEGHPDHGLGHLDRPSRGGTPRTFEKSKAWVRRRHPVPDHTERYSKKIRT